MNQNEVFKDVKNYEGLYQISNLGNVKSLRNNIILKPRITLKYQTVGLYKDNKMLNYKIHVLVGIMFLGYKNENRFEVLDHIDNDKSNNCVKNLQVITQRKNMTKDRKNKTSKYVGVSVVRLKKGDKWRSQILINKKVYYLGLFNTELEAHNAYINKLKNINCIS